MIRARHSDLTMTVYIGDCISGMRKHIDSGSIDLCVADPPFGIGFDKIGKGGSYERNRDLVTDGYVEVPREKYDAFTHDWLEQMYRCLKSTGSAYIFSGWTNLPIVAANIEKIGFTLINHIIWRYQFGVFTKRKFSTSHYHVLFIVKDESKYNFYKENENEQIEDVWVFTRHYTKDEERYPTKLPSMVVRKCLKYSSREQNIVMDPFLGSGTSLAVADEMNRNFVGFEMNQRCQPLYETIRGDIDCQIV